MLKLNKSSIKLDLKEKKVIVIDKTQFAIDFKNVTGNEFNIKRFHRLDGRKNHLIYENIGDQISYKFINWNKFQQRMVRSHFLCF